MILLHAQRCPHCSNTYVFAFKGLDGIGREFCEWKVGFMRHKKRCVVREAAKKMRFVKKAGRLNFYYIRGAR